VASPLVARALPEHARESDLRVEVDEDAPGRLD
jgi:hypothetical protein